MTTKTTAINSIQNKLVMAASKNDIAKINDLLKKGADVDGANKYGMTPLFTAVSYHSVEAVEALLKAGADPNIGVKGYVDYGYKSPTYDTPLHIAEWDADSAVPELAMKHKKMVELLKHYGTIK